MHPKDLQSQGAPTKPAGLERARGRAKPRLSSNPKLTTISTSDLDNTARSADKDTSIQEAVPARRSERALGICLADVRLSTFHAPPTRLYRFLFRRVWIPLPMRRRILGLSPFRCQLPAGTDAEMRGSGLSSGWGGSDSLPGVDSGPMAVAAWMGLVLHEVTMPGRVFLGVQERSVLDDVHFLLAWVTAFRLSIGSLPSQKLTCTAASCCERANTFAQIFCHEIRLGIQ